MVCGVQRFDSCLCCPLRVAEFTLTNTYVILLLDYWRLLGPLGPNLRQLSHLQNTNGSHTLPLRRYIVTHLKTSGNIMYRKYCRLSTQCISMHVTSQTTGSSNRKQPERNRPQYVMPCRLANSYRNSEIILCFHLQW